MEKGWNLDNGCITSDASTFMCKKGNSGTSFTNSAEGNWTNPVERQNEEMQLNKRH